ncbi:MAG: Kelch repeat-containing protein, partial [archaeon]
YAADDFWITLEPMPTARSGLGVAVVDGKIYAIGGGTWGNYFGTNEMCDPDTNGWITKTSMPTPRSSFGIAVIENKIYCIGGYTDDEETKINEVYDPATDTWETLTPMPTARYALKANVVNGKIYMIGGHTGAPSPYLDVNEVYNPATDSWTTKTPLTTEVGYYASVVVDNKIYIIGGYGSNLTQIYDPETDTWNNGASIPTVVDSASAGVTTGTMATQRIYVIGGKQDLDAVNLNQIYDPETDTWSTGTPMPTARYGLGVAIVNDVLYALGGKEGWIGSPISVANEQYIPSGYIPEFPSWAILPLVIIVMLGAIIYKHKLKRLTFKGHV